MDDVCVCAAEGVTYEAVSTRSIFHAPCSAPISAAPLHTAHFAVPSVYLSLVVYVVSLCVLDVGVWSGVLCETG